VCKFSEQSKEIEMTTTNSLRENIQPMGWKLSVLFFGVPGVLSLMASWVVSPGLVGMGMTPVIFAQVIPGVIVLALMLVAALTGFWLEGHPLTWVGLKERFRLCPMTGKLWLWVIGAGMFGIIMDGSVGPRLSHWLVGKGILPLPASIPAWLDPRVDTPFMENFGVLRGNWAILGLAITAFTINTLGEELWWRGYILPRQELAFGKWAWLVNGAMWAAIFHMSIYWEIPGLLPMDLLWVFVAWKSKNNTTLLIMHGLQLFSFPLFILLGVLGVV
jgi:membrane protease YdiL (CAAX protease family)